MKNSCENPDYEALRREVNDLYLREGALLLRVLKLEDRVKELEKPSPKREATLLTFRRVSA